MSAERAEGVHKSAKVVVSVTEIMFCTEEVPVTVSSDNSSEGIRYMDPISKVFYRILTQTFCSPLYSNALELLNGS